MSAPLALVLAVLVLAAVPIDAQGPVEAEDRRQAVTAGLGMSYSGLGVAGEFDLWPRRVSGLVGVGGLPSWIPLGLTAGLRVRLRSARDPIYLQLSGSYFTDDSSLYGPAVLIGRSNDGRRGTLHFAIGAGRAVNGSVTLALDVGFGWFRGGARRRPRADDEQGDRQADRIPVEARGGEGHTPSTGRGR